MVLRYHQETKHHFQRYARSLGFMDWANQPNPFRRFEGSPRTALPLLGAREAPLPPPYEGLYRPGAGPSVPVTLRSLSRFFEYSLAITAWKQAGATRWALRANPSSGNLHPTEGYLVVDGVPDLAPDAGLYHYTSEEHALELRAKLPHERFAALVREFPSGAFLVGFSSVNWRETWKYGERAFRYCQHDVGHAIGGARIAARTLGWRMLLLDGVADDGVAALLGLDRVEDFAGAEREHPDALALVWPGDRAVGKSLPLSLPAHALRVSRQLVWHGKANRLSRNDPVRWEALDQVEVASWKPESGLRLVEPDGDTPSGESAPEGENAGQVIHRRRSALALDGRTSIAGERFFAMLARVMPHADRALLHRPMPWDVVPWEPAIHLLLFVHRVEGVTPGVYMLVRDPAKTGWLRSIMRSGFAWIQPPGCPDDLPLFLLQEGDARRLATAVSCHQDIAGDGAFSLGMIAELESSLRRHGPWFYRRLFWETGVIGQVLYLEAEAGGVRATGIGCFFDDPVHELIGIHDTALQSLYHFTIGGPVEDPRLTTLPPYELEH